MKAEAVDARTARVTFRKASAGRRDAFNLPLLSASAWKDGDVATHPRNRNPLANGPYRLGAWDAGRTPLSRAQHAVLRRTPAPAEQVVFRVVPETAPAFAASSPGTSTRCASRSRRRGKSTRRPGRRARRAAVTFDELSYAYFGWNNRLAALLGPPRAPGAHDARRPREHRPQPLRRAREARERAAPARPLGVERLDRALAVRPGAGRQAPRRGRLP